VAASCGRLLFDWAGPARWPQQATKDGAFAELRGSPAAPATLHVLARNVEAWAARWELLAGARYRVDVAYFILTQDVFGLAFLGHLWQRADDGVTVRILVDGQGMRMAPSPDGIECLPALAESPRVSIERFRPVPRRVAQGLLTLTPTVALASTHDKLLVADGVRAIVGGRNIATKYFAHPADLPVAFSDMDVLTEGEPTAAALTAVFDAAFASDEARAIVADGDGPCPVMLRGAHAAMNAWLRGDAEPADPGAARWWHELARHPRLRGALRERGPRSVRAETRVVDSAPRVGDPHDPVSDALFALLKGAERRVLVVTPYLVLTETAVAAFETAGRRGVETTILTNSPVSSDNALSQQLFLEQWPRLLARVPGLRLFVVGGTRNEHGKLAVVDDSTTMIGSNNLDPLSLTVNGEVAIVVRSRRFARAIAGPPERLLRGGAPAVFEYRIARHTGGQAVRDETGRPVVAFGPHDHSRPESWPAVLLRWKLLALVAKVPGSPQLF
jgi:phosphatidylserine/phosphatidylglycerophosphate/cardiolipin synthase-like enzyme